MLNQTRWALLSAVCFLLFVSTASACPGCTYERMLLTNWYQKVWILKLAIPLVFAFNRLDVLRVFYVFFAYTYGFIIAFKYLVWFSHPAVSDGFIGLLAMIGLGIFALNIPDAALLFGLGCVAFFRRDKARALPLWQVIAFAVTASVISLTILSWN